MNKMENDVYSFYELVSQYAVKIPILQRDYAQGRKENLPICENILKAMKESILQNKTINFFIPRSVGVGRHIT